MKSVWDYCQIACEGREVKPLSYSQTREYVKDLNFRGLHRVNPEKTEFQPYEEMSVTI